MNVVVTADWHGHLPPEIPECDLLVIAGDIFPDLRQLAWVSELSRYLEQVPARSIVAVAGNHDWIAQERPIQMKSLPWTYLCNETAFVQGLNIWGSPFSSSFGEFSVHEHELARLFRTIPDSTDVVVTHCPAYGRGDLMYDEHVGSRSLRTRVDELDKLRLHACGHIHEGRGSGPLSNGIGWWINGAYCGPGEQPGNPLVALRI